MLIAQCVAQSIGQSINQSDHPSFCPYAHFIHLSCLRYLHKSLFLSSVRAVKKASIFTSFHFSTTQLFIFSKSTRKHFPLKLSLGRKRFCHAFSLSCEEWRPMPELQQIQGMVTNARGTANSRNGDKCQGYSKFKEWWQMPGLQQIQGMAKNARVTANQRHGNKYQGYSKFKEWRRMPGLQQIKGMATKARLRQIWGYVLPELKKTQFFHWSD